MFVFDYNFYVILLHDVTIYNIIVSTKYSFTTLNMYTDFHLKIKNRLKKNYLNNLKEYPTKNTIWAKYIAYILSRSYVQLSGMTEL